MQNGYGGDGAQGGYGEQLQAQVMAQSGIDLAKPACKPGTVGFFKKDATLRVSESRIDDLRKKFPNVAGPLRECFLYTYDLCLQICGMKVSDCEAQKDKCIKKTCDENREHDKCEKAAAEQWKHSKMMSGLIWKGNQENACECTPSGNAGERRKQELHAFYGKHAPENVHKVDSLAAKYQARWPLLMLTLHQKYQQSVHLVTHEEEKREKEKEEKLEKEKKEAEEAKAKE